MSLAPMVLSRQAAVNEKVVLENILRSATGTAVIASDLECRVNYCNPAVAAMPKLQALATPAQDLRETLARLGWADCRAVLVPEALRDGRMHRQELQWTAGADSLRVELQVSLLVDERNQPHGYLFLAR